MPKLVTADEVPNPAVQGTLRDNLEALVPATHLVVGDQGRSILLGQRLEVAFTVVAGIGGNQGVGGAERASGVHHRHQQRLLAARAMGLRGDDDLVAVIHRRHARIALDDAFRRGHLGRLVVGAVALDDQQIEAQWLTMRRWLEANPDDELAKDVRAKLTSEPERYAAYTREYLGWGVFALMPR